MVGWRSTRAHADESSVKPCSELADGSCVGLARRLHVIVFAMNVPLQISFRFPVTPSQAIHDRVAKRVEQLATFSSQIIGCHVTLDSPHLRQGHGRHYAVRIEVSVPGVTLNITRDPNDRVVREDLYAAIDDAFANAERQVKAYAQQARDTERRAGRADREGHYARAAGGAHR